MNRGRVFRSLVATAASIGLWYTVKDVTAFAGAPVPDALEFPLGLLFVCTVALTIEHLLQPEGK